MFKLNGNCHDLKLQVMMNIITHWNCKSSHHILRLLLLTSSRKLHHKRNKPKLNNTKAKKKIISVVTMTSIAKDLRKLF